MRAWFILLLTLCFVAGPAWAQYSGGGGSGGASTDSANTWTADQTADDDVTWLWGASGDAGLEYDTANTPDVWKAALDATGNTLHIMELADKDFDFNNCSASTSAQTDPTLCIHSANQSTTEWIEFRHDQTNAIITAGTGAFHLVEPGGADYFEVSFSSNIPIVATGSAYIGVDDNLVPWAHHSKTLGNSSKAWEGLFTRNLNDGIYKDAGGTTNVLLSGYDSTNVVNQSGGHITIEGGEGRGDGNPGEIRFDMPDKVGSGNGLQSTSTTLVKITYEGFQLIDPGTQPTCDSGLRGAIWYEAGGAGVADSIEVCAKDSGDSYAWVAMASIS